MISFSYKGAQNGRKYKEEIEIKINNPNEIKISETDSSDDQITTTMNVELTRFK